MTGRRAGIRTRLAAMALAFVATTAPAMAQGAGRPMTFEWGMTYDNVPAIFADGDFTPETPAALRAFIARSNQPTRDRTIYFNSLGGDLGAGMEVGRIVRRAEMNTGVARNTRDPSQADTIDLDAYSKVYPGHCVSACTLAFLGGVKRDVKAGSIFAVHQVSMNCVKKEDALARFPWVKMPNVAYCPDLDEALSMMQVANGVVVEYIRSMGVDPIFLSEMTRAGPDTVNTLSEERLREYRIVFEFKSESWAFETNSAGEFFLQYLQGDQWRQDKVEIYCNRTSGPRLHLWLVHDVKRSGGPIDGQRMVDLASQGLTAVWQLDGQSPGGFADVRSVPLLPTEIVEAPRLTERGNIALTVDLTQRFLDVIVGATRFQIVTTAADPASTTGSGFNLITMNLDRNKIAGIVRSCK